MKSESVFKDIEIISVTGVMPEEIANLCDRANECGNGDCFFAVNGEEHFGIDYVDEAIRRGATLIVSSLPIEISVCNVVVNDVRICQDEACRNFYSIGDCKVKIVGVVGTNGKTSVCHILNQIFEYAKIKTGYLGTLGGKIGNKRYDTALTTPKTIDIYKFIAEAEKEEAKYLFIELSAHAIAQNRGSGIYFECLIFTNCTEDHLDYFKSLKSYAQVKKSVFKREKCKYMLINSDDATGREILRENEDKNVFSYAVFNPSDIFAIDINENKNGISFIVNLFDMVYDIKSSLIGFCNVYNLLAALGFGALAGLKMHTLGGAAKKITAVSGRLEKVATLSGADIFLDYAHTPDGLKTTLNSLKKICDGKLYCLFGCGGNREKEKRSVMGEISGIISDYTIITSDNPRFEDPCMIISEIESGIRKVTRNYITIVNREDAVDYAISLLKEGDVLVIAGKGAENYQEIMGVRRDYSDRTVINNAVKKFLDGDGR